MGHRGIRPSSVISIWALSSPSQVPLYVGLIFPSLFTDWVLCSVSLFPACGSPPLCPNGGLSSPHCSTLMASLSASQLHTPGRESVWPVVRPPDAELPLSQGSGVGPGRDRSGAGHTGLGARSQLRFASAPWLADLMGLSWGKTPHTGDLGVAVGFGYDLLSPFTLG